MILSSITLSFVLIALGLFGSWTSFLSPIFGFYISVSGLACLSLLLFASLIFLFTSKSKGKSFLGVFVGLWGAGGLAGLGYLFYLHPMTDISTDLANPPKFLTVAYIISVKSGHEFLDQSFVIDRAYNPAFGTVQVKSYPNLKSKLIQLSPTLVFPQILTAIKTQLPEWKIVFSDEQSGHIELEVESTPFKFIDDIALELRPSNQGNDTELVIRSRRRQGISDFGIGIRNIEDLSIRLSLSALGQEQIEKIKRDAEAKRLADQKKKEEEDLIKAKAEITPAPKPSAESTVSEELRRKLRGPTPRPKE